MAEKDITDVELEFGFSSKAMAAEIMRLRFLFGIIVQTAEASKEKPIQDEQKNFKASYGDSKVEF